MYSCYNRLKNRKVYPIGVSDESRTRMAEAEGFSSYSMLPQPHYCVVVWTIPSPCIICLGARRLVSTRSSIEASLGIVPKGVPPNLTRFTWEFPTQVLKFT